jgi:hypothetical protein
MVNVSVEDVGAKHHIEESSSCTKNDGTEGWSVNINASALDNGAITIKAQQSANGLVGQSQVTAVKDTVLPTVAISQFPLVNAQNVTAVTLTGTCSEDKLPIGLSITDIGKQIALANYIACNNGSWAVTKDLSGLSDGLLEAIATQTDEAGNQGISNQAQSVKDVMSGSLTIDSFPAVTDQNQTAVTIIGTCTEAKYPIQVSVADWSNPNKLESDKGVECVGGRWQVIKNLLALQDGPIYATATQTDGTGNTITATAVSVKDTTNTE